MLTPTPRTAQLSRRLWRLFRQSASRRPWSSCMPCLLRGSRSKSRGSSAAPPTPPSPSRAISRRKRRRRRRPLRCAAKRAAARRRRPRSRRLRRAQQRSARHRAWRVAADQPRWSRPSPFCARACHPSIELASTRSRCSGASEPARRASCTSQSTRAARWRSRWRAALPASRRGGERPWHLPRCVKRSGCEVELAAVLPSPAVLMLLARFDSRMAVARVRAAAPSEHCALPGDGR